MRISQFLLASIILVFSAQTATAEEFKLNLAFGIKGGLNGSVVNGVKEGDTFTADGNELSVAQGPDIYPMFGLGGSVGGFVEVRAWDIVGLELGLFQSWDNGNGFEDKNNAGTGETLGRIDQKQRTSALHFPIMAKASIPAKLVRPTFGIGAEFVFQNTSTLEYSSDRFTISERDDGYEFGNLLYKIEPTSYVNFIFSFALEFDIDPVRIPIELRLQINPSFDSAAEPRLNATGTPNRDLAITYDGVYQAQFSFFTGIAYDFDITFE